MRLPLRSPKGYPLKAALLPFLPDRQANASYPKREKKELLNPPHWMGGGYFCSPAPHPQPQRVFLEFLVQFSLPPLSGPERRWSSH